PEARRRDNGCGRRPGPAPLLSRRLSAVPDGALRAGSGLAPPALGPAQEPDGPRRRHGPLLRLDRRLRRGLYAQRCLECELRPGERTRRGRTPDVPPRLRVPELRGPRGVAGGSRRRHMTEETRLRTLRALPPTIDRHWPSYRFGCIL